MTVTQQQRLVDMPAVLELLQTAGPLSEAEIRGELKLTKRRFDVALYHLQSRALVEYGWPLQTPLTYKATTA